MGQDTQNVVVVGNGDADMALVINTLREQQGISGCRWGRVQPALLPIAGIMTDVSQPIKTRSSQVRFDLGFREYIDKPVPNPSLQIVWL